jgi:hypothetical protein
MGRPKKYSDEQKKVLRERYSASRSGNLTTYAGLIGDQFAYRVNVLAQLLRDAHDYSLGRYKERLLSKLIADAIPSRYAVGTGFVLFPAEKSFNGPVPTGFDAMNRADHEVSRQCDIIVYDHQQYPVVFQDDDFVVVLPEAVRAIVEVKGTLNAGEIDDAVDHLIDFGKKWHRCDRFYITHHNPRLHEPSLFVLAWQVGINPDGTPQTDSMRLRERIAERYKKSVSVSELESFAYLTAAYIYKEAEVASTLSFDKDEILLGFWTTEGKLYHYGPNQEIVEAGDGTIASLISRIHGSFETPFNRFVSYKDEATPADQISTFEKNFSTWLRGAEVDAFKWAERR